MTEDNNKRIDEAKKEEQPGGLSSFNNRDAKRSTEAEGAKATTSENEKKSPEENDKDRTE